MDRPPRIRSVLPQHGFRVLLELSDGSTRQVDLEPYLRGPIFEAIRTSPVEFARIQVDPRAGTVCWPNGADIDPDVLLLGRVPAWGEESLIRAS